MFLGEPSSFKVFNGLGEAHPHYEVGSALLNIYGFKC